MVEVGKVQKAKKPKSIAAVDKKVIRSERSTSHSFRKKMDGAPAYSCKGKRLGEFVSFVVVLVMRHFHFTFLSCSIAMMFPTAFPDTAL